MSWLSKIFVSAKPGHPFESRNRVDGTTPLLGPPVLLVSDFHRVYYGEKPDLLESAIIAICLSGVEIFIELGFNFNIARRRRRMLVVDYLANGYS